MTGAMKADLDACLTEVSSDRLMVHIAEFSKRVKLSGSPDELESFRYLESCMAAYGYRTQLLAHDAYISLPSACLISADGVALNSITHSMSAPTGPKGIEGALVYVGEGFAEDFAAHDVAGKIVLIDGIAVEDVADRASRAGAIGEIHISPTEQLYEMCISPVWGSPSDITRDLLPKTSAATISAADGGALRQRCLAGDSVAVRMVTEVDSRWRKTPLLVCDLALTAATADGAFVMFSGHHDTWHFGVMDNGGANATMLEAARLLAGAQASLRRGLRVCFWSGHSHGRYSGSAWYADENWLDLERHCAAHVNVDSTGAIGASVLTKSGVVDELRPLARQIIAAETGQQHEGRRQSRAADQSFWGIGIPSMFGSLSHQPPGAVKMLVALGWWWHTPLDLADKIDPANLVRDTRIALRALWHLLVDPVLPFDYAGYCETLMREVAAIAPVVNARLQNAAEVLLVDVVRLHAAARRLAEEGDHAGTKAERINHALMRASRALVPLNYTSGERFHHDPAVPQPAWLALEPLRALAALPEGSDAIPFVTVRARQARNRLQHAIRLATEHLESAF